MRNKIYRDPRGSLISMDMLGITVRSWSFGGGGSVKKHTHIYMYIYVYICIYICIYIYGETGVEKKTFPLSRLCTAFSIGSILFYFESLGDP